MACDGVDIGIEIGVRIVDVLLQAGADTEDADPGNVTALQSALEMQQVGAVRLLLQAGAPMMSPEQMTKSKVVHNAVENGDEETGQYYALHMAAYKVGHGEVVQILAQAGCDLDMRAGLGSWLSVVVGVGVGVYHGANLEQTRSESTVSR
eukprot:gene8299-9858_t